MRSARRGRTQTRRSWTCAASALAAPLRAQRRRAGRRSPTRRVRLRSAATNRRRAGLAVAPARTTKRRTGQPSRQTAIEFERRQARCRWSASATVVRVLSAVASKQSHRAIARHAARNNEARRSRPPTRVARLRCGAPSRHRHPSPRARCPSSDAATDAMNDQPRLQRLLARALCLLTLAAVASACHFHGHYGCGPQVRWCAPVRHCR